MLGHYEDNGYGGETFVPYYESDDEAYEQMVLMDEEHEEGDPEPEPRCSATVVVRLPHDSTSSTELLRCLLLESECDGDHEFAQ